jgi:hypothetical protein
MYVDVGHMIMGTVKNKRFDYTTSPIVEYYVSKRCKNCKNVSAIAPPKRILSNPLQIADNTDKCSQRQTWGRKGNSQIGVNLMVT